MSMHCDARRTKQRTPRIEYRCTMCAKELPQNRRKWGLVWDSGIHGACVACVVRVRKGLKADLE